MKVGVKKQAAGSNQPTGSDEAIRSTGSDGASRHVIPCGIHAFGWVARGSLQTLNRLQPFRMPQRADRDDPIYR